MIYDKLNRYQESAEDETKQGGNPQNGLVFALLAVSEAIRVTEPSERVEISGSLTVDS